MRLTNAMRDAFIRQVMNDVPRVDYDEQIQKIALSAIVAAMPTNVREAFNNNPDWINTEHIDLPGAGWRRRPCPTHSRPSIAEADADAMRKLRVLDEAQDKLREELEAKLRAAAYACTTNAKLLELLPEFEKYIPKDGAASSRSLPVVQNMVADFIKAGWPKQAATA